MSVSVAFADDTRRRLSAGLVVDIPAGFSDDPDFVVIANLDSETPNQENYLSNQIDVNMNLVKAVDGGFETIAIKEFKEKPVKICLPKLDNSNSKLTADSVYCGKRPAEDGEQTEEAEATRRL